MKEWRCRKCQYIFCSESDIPYCPACDCEYIVESMSGVDKYLGENIEGHHLHPRFMSNWEGNGEIVFITKKRHDILHGLIMRWLWEEVGDKEEAIKNIIKKSKEFLK